MRRLLGALTLGAGLISGGAPQAQAQTAPSIGGSLSCAPTGGTDVLFLLDNSSSITAPEYSQFAASVANVGQELRTANPATRIAVAHYAGPINFPNFGQHIYFERDFSTDAVASPVRRFPSGAWPGYNNDNLAGAVLQMSYGLDDDSATTSSFILSPLRELNRDLTRPLQIVVFTDAWREQLETELVPPRGGSAIIDGAGYASPVKDGTDFTIYNRLKAQGVKFSMVAFYSGYNPSDNAAQDALRNAAAAAISSIGGAWTGSVETNFIDPEGFGTPRRLVLGSASFTLSAAQILDLVAPVANQCPPLLDYGDAPASYGAPSHAVVAGGPYLGANPPDSESFPQHSADALGDDQNGIDDEDGISVFPLLESGATSYSIPAANISVSGTGTLHAWIDFDKSGTFTADEHASVSVTVGSLSGSLNWSGVTAGEMGGSFARFRFTSANLTDNPATPGLDERAVGFAADGEVEDHAVVIGPPPLPNIGGAAACTVWGGTDVLFLLDNSGSISAAEYATFASAVTNIGQNLRAANPATRIATAHYAGPASPADSFGQNIYFERDFSTAALVSPVRQFGVGGAFNSAFTNDNLAGAVRQMSFGLDGSFGTTSSFIVSPLKELARDLTRPLQIVVFTDGFRSEAPTSSIIDGAGYGSSEKDGTDFTVYNLLKAQGVKFSVMALPEGGAARGGPRTSASAAIASVGGAWTGAKDANLQDPEGSGTPRRVISPASFSLTAAQILEFVTPVASACLPPKDYGDAPASYGAPEHVITLGGPYLGAGRPDAETGPQHSADALGDDQNGVDDEDGVFDLQTLFSGVTSYSITAESISATGTGTLHAWIDFNRNGAFTANEHASVTVTNGVPAGPLNWTGITAGSAGLTFARFRFTSATLTDNTGTTAVDERATAPAADGEVEDHTIMIETLVVPQVGGTLTCSPTGGTDVLFLIDNSGSIDSYEYASFAAAVVSVGGILRTANPASRIATAHYAGTTSPPLASFGQHVYFERDFSTATVTAPLRRFASGGSYNSSMIMDNMAGAVRQMSYGLDLQVGTTSSFIISPLKELARDLTRPLQIVAFTDALRDWDGSSIIDGPGYGSLTKDGTDFTIYNQLKAQGVKFSVVAFTTSSVTYDIPRNAAAAAIASIGGAWMDSKDPNSQDPEGSGMPRRLVASNNFTLGAAQILDLVMPVANVCPPPRDYGDAPASYGAPGHAVVVGGPYLGVNPPDAEAAPLHSADARGDDQNGIDDEDGISVFPRIEVGETSYSIPAANISATGTGRLYAWIDFDKDGVFGPHEYATATVTNGVLSGPLNWTGIAFGSPGGAFLRLRFTSSILTDDDPTSLDYTFIDERSIAPASDGEVEDHMITVEPMTIPQIGGAPVCTVAGGTDVLFLIDNSASVSAAEYTSFAASVVSVGEALRGINPATRIATAHYAGPTTVGNSGQNVYFDRDFSTAAVASPVRRFGPTPLLASNADSLAGAVYHMGFGLDGDSATTSANILSPLKEFARDLSRPLQIVIFTDATRDAALSNVVDGLGYGYEPSDGSDFTIYNLFKAQGVKFSVATLPSGQSAAINNARDAAAAAIASLGGSWAGARDANLQDPEGSGSPRRLVTSASFALSAAQILDFVSPVANFCLPPIDYGDAPASYGAPGHAVVVGGPYLGVNPPDAEAAPLHSADALGDDQNGIDDEDGISVFPPLYAGALSYSIPAANISATGTGTLHVWVDFNKNGAFTANEHASVTVTDGVLSGPLNWTGITVGSVGPSFTRIRFTSSVLTDNAATAALDERSTLLASDGEIEDHATPILDPRSSLTPFVCEARLYQVFGSSGQFASLNLHDATMAYLPNSVGALVNGAGYRAADNLVYFVSEGAPRRLFAAGANGATIDLGAISGTLPNVVYNTGDFDGDGYLNIKHQTTSTIYRINVDTGQVHDSYAISGFTANTSDIAYNVADGWFYTVANNRLWRFRRGSALQNIGPIGAALNGAYGAMYGASGRIFGANNADGAVVEFDLTTGAGSVIGYTVGGLTSNDGFSCPTADLRPIADFSVAKTNGVTSLLPGQIAEYLITVTNHGPATVAGAILSDPAAAGLSKTSVACAASTPGRCAAPPSVAELESGSFALPSMAAGESYRLTVTAQTLADAGSVRNTASVSVPAAYLDPNLVNNLAVDVDEVVGAPLVLRPNHESVVEAGQLAIYPHQLMVSPELGGGALSFAIDTERSLAWLLLRDDGDGVYGLGDAPWIPGAAVPAGEHLFWLVAKTPQDAPGGWSDLTRLTAFLVRNGVNWSSGVHDLTRIGGSGSGSVFARKLQAPDADCDGAPDGGEAGFTERTLSIAPGQCVIYRILFENRSVDPIHQVRVQDHTPSWMLHIGASANALSWAVGLTPLPPEQPAAGEEGPVSFSFSGSLQPGGGGMVQFSAYLPGLPGSTHEGVGGNPGSGSGGND